MFEFITKGLAKIFGDKSSRDIKNLLPIVDEVNKEFELLKDLTNDQIRGKTIEFRTRIKEYLSEIEKEIKTLNLEAEDANKELDQKEDVYKKIDKINKEKIAGIEEILNEILPEAFAVVKEASRRFSTQEIISVTATDLDKKLAKTKDFVRIEGDQAIYQNHWLAAGVPVKWNMVHYDVQIIGGIVLHKGKIAEMGTGEGKTLVSTLPAYLNALPQMGVHIVTVNDYLAKRDSEWNGPLYNFLGLTVDCIDKHESHSEGRKNAYLADITYGTNNEFGFDYLRDNMVRFGDEQVQKLHHFAMVDEVDSVLIDDARTPLIISGPVPKGDEHEFHDLKPRIQRLVEAQKKVVMQQLNEAKKLITEGKTGPKEGQGGLALLRAHRALPKNKMTIKFLSEAGNRQFLQKAENYYLQDQGKEMPFVDSELYFTIEERSNQIDLTEKGIELITLSGEEKDFFIMPDLGVEMAEIETNITDEKEKLRLKDELIRDFSIKSDRLHSVNQLLKAYTLFEIDIEYVVMDGKVKIVDEQTGRILDGRRYSDGLHQAIEAKENVKVESATQTFATITLQNFFRMYNKLCGMTGTAETEAAEFWEIYKLDTVVIPTNRPLIRDDREDLVYKTKREKYNAVIEEITKLQQEGRPVLVGTTNVEVSELLGKMLRIRKIEHNVLNAKQHQKEADIVAAAGLPGTVTIATNMAGRGTDIKLGDGIKEKGGLAIIGTERHDSRRVDRQLRGRAGRQGDSGSSQFYASLEDDLMRIFGSDRLAGWMDKMGYKEGEVIQHSMVTKSIERAQKKVEENNFGMRKRLLEYDDVMNAQRSVIYKRRQHALYGDRVSFDLINMVYDLCEELVIEGKESKNYEEFKIDCLRYFSIDADIKEEELFNGKVDEITNNLFHQANDLYIRKSEEIRNEALPVLTNIYQEKSGEIENIIIPFSNGIKTVNLTVPLAKAIETLGVEITKAMEKSLILTFIDQSWKEHLRQLDELKQSVQLAVHEQKDPLVVYKMEAFQLFKSMLSEINKEICSFLFKAELPGKTQEIKTPIPRVEKTDYSRMKESRPDDSAAESNGSNNNSNQPEEEKVKQVPIRVEAKAGRNDPCPCGSGKKYKHCHGREE